MSIRSFFFQSGEHFTPIAGLRMCLDKAELELGIRHEVLQNAEAHLGQKIKRLLDAMEEVACGCGVAQSLRRSIA
jgi:hypothetical protein